MTRTKNLLIVFVGLCFVLVGLVAGLYYPRQVREERREAVQRVLNERVVACSNSFQLVPADEVTGDKAYWQLDGEQYVPRLQKIDLRGCPVEFTVAWTNYVGIWSGYISAIEKRRQKNLTAVAAAMVTANPGPLTTLQFREPTLAGKDEAWKNCTNIAASYGAH